MRASKTQICDSEEANIAENLFEVEEQYEAENCVGGTEDMLKVKKDGRRRNVSFVDEAARLAEIDAYLFCGNVDGAIQVFNKCRRKGHKFDVSTFNIILHGLAAKKRVLDFQVFYHNMAGDDVKANIQTYAAVLGLYGQLKDVNMIEDTCVKMNSLGFNIEHIFQKSILNKEQATRVLEAIRMAYPNYEAEICVHTQPTHSSPLVKSLYQETKTNILEYNGNTPDTLVQDVMRHFEQQLKQERLGFGTLKSVERKKNETKTGQDNHKSFLEIQSRWKERLTCAIEREIELVNAQNKGPFQIFQ